MLKPLKIICTGNGFLEEDSIGTRVYEYMKNMNLPSDVELIDGGLGGLDNAVHLKNAKRVVFVDAVKGFTDDGGIKILGFEQTAALADSYGHSAGLPYLFRMAEHIIDGNLPEMYVVGCENGTADIEKTAKISLEVTLHGVSGL